VGRAEKGRQVPNCRHNTHGRVSGGCREAGQPVIGVSEGRGMCRADSERPERTVGHLGVEIDSGGRRAKG